MHTVTLTKEELEAFKELYVSTGLYDLVYYNEETGDPIQDVYYSLFCKLGIKITNPFYHNGAI